MTHNKEIDSEEITSLNERIDSLKLRSGLQPYQELTKGWASPDIHYGPYARPEKKAGVYAFIGFKDNRIITTGEILYIGSSKEIQTRYASHNMFKKIASAGYDSVRFYFSYCPDYRELEKKLIRQYCPLFNSRYDG